MDNQFFVCVYFDGIILTTIVGCIFECWQQIAMRFNRNILFDDMKEMISAKIARRCGRWISKLFYNFPVSTYLIKFTKMELVDDEDVETMIALYCENRSDQNALIHLFVELAGVEPTEDLTVYGEEHGAQELCMVAPISYVDIGEDGYNNSDPCDQEVDSDSDIDVDEVLDDIDDEDVNDDGNINASSVGNQIRRIMIHNKPRPYMSLIDPDTAHIVEFPVYPEILHAHRLAVNFDPEKLDFDKSYNELQGWIAAMREYVRGTVIELQIQPYYGPDDQLQPGKRIFHRMFWTFDPCVRAFPHCKSFVERARATHFRKKMTRLESDMEGQMNTSFRQWLGTMEPWQWAQIFYEGFHYGQMTTNLVEGINTVLLKTRHLPILSVFSVTFYRLATLMPRMGQQQVNQMEVGHVFIEDVKDAMVANC
ncbi:hypothetical protein GOBAR_DD07906 [Gossypium barbadense]|nr:hypothetical protein GOBAR_DD07906 [Gossypium barbadense]